MEFFFWLVGSLVGWLGFFCLFVLVWFGLLVCLGGEGSVRKEESKAVFSCFGFFFPQGILPFRRRLGNMSTWKHKCTRMSYKCSTQVHQSNSTLAVHCY